MGQEGCVQSAFLSVEADLVMGAKMEGIRKVL